MIHPHSQPGTICACLHSKDHLPRMSTNLQVAGRREKQWKADCIYVPFMYNLCTIFRVISYNYQRVTASNMYNCLQACFSEYSQSQKPKQSHVFYSLVSYRDRTCLRILFFVGFSTYSPYRENTFSLQGEHLIPARRKHYPCREKTLPLQGEQAIDVIR